MSVTSWFDISSLANSLGAKYPELVAAQWALESAWGAKVSGKNNYFGIKGKGTKHLTTEFVNGKEVQIIEEFKDFESVQECVKELVDMWYKDYRDHKGVNNAKDREAAALALTKEGYATDPKYTEKLIEIMKKNSVPIQSKVSSTTFINLKDAARWYGGHPHQISAWDSLQNSLNEAQLLAFAKAYRNSGTTSPPVKLADKKFPLSVPYFYQRDSKTGHGERSCQSSAIAMCIDFLNPSLIKDDDDYLKIVFKYGDTVSQSAHAKALNELGIKQKFLTNGAESTLIRILDRGCPVPIGILHKGSINSPSGGGHWITLIGYDDKNFYVHDPFGELDLENGGYPKRGPTDGKNQRYSKKNLLKRWLIASNSDGWYWDLSENIRP